MLRTKRVGTRKERGQALMEFALLAPLLVILIFGFIDITRLYNAWVTVQGAAREGARYGVTGRSDCPAAPDDRTVCIKYWASQRAKNLTNSATGVSVTVRSWNYPAYADPAAEGDPGNQCDALEVEVEYDFEPSTPLASALIGAVGLSGSERLVNEPYGPCET